MIPRLRLALDWAIYHATTGGAFVGGRDDEAEARMTLWPERERRVRRTLANGPRAVTPTVGGTDERR